MARGGNITALLGEVERLKKAVEPFAALGGPNDGIMPAFYDLPDDVIVYSNSGKHITAGDVRAARAALGWLHAPWKITTFDDAEITGSGDE